MAQLGTIVRSYKNIIGTVENPVVYGDRLDRSNRQPWTVAHGETLEINGIADPGDFLKTPTSHTRLHSDVYSLKKTLLSTFDHWTWPTSATNQHLIPHDLISLDPPSGKAKPRAETFSEGEFAYVLRDWEASHAQRLAYGDVIRIASDPKSKTGRAIADKTTRLSYAHYRYQKVAIEEKVHAEFLSDHFLYPAYLRQ